MAEALVQRQATEMRRWQLVRWGLGLGLVLALALTNGQVRSVAAAKTIKVGATASGCNGPCDYTSLGTAIQAAVSGDTISVYPGTYQGPIAVDKPVTLMAAGDRDKTIVEANGSERSVITVTADGARVSGFTVQKSTLDGIRIWKASNVTVENNLVRQTGTAPINQFTDPVSAILVQAGKSNKILNNLVTDNSGRGIRVEGLVGMAEGHLVKGNYISRSLGGCALVITTNVINNVFENNRIEFGHNGGIIVANLFPDGIVKGNVIQNNEIKWTVRDPGILISLTAGRNPDQVSGNIIRFNEVEANEGYAGLPEAPQSIGIVLARVTGNQVYGNKIWNQQMGIASTFPTFPNEVRDNQFFNVATPIYTQPASAAPPPPPGAGAPAAPASLPRTGDQVEGIALALAILGGLALGLGLAARRRMKHA